MANLVAHIVGLGRILDSDMELTPHEISLYTAIILVWNTKHRPNNFFEVGQTKMMKLSRIGNARTYSKYLKSLSTKKLITYKRGSAMMKARVYVLPLNQGKTEPGITAPDAMANLNPDNGEIATSLMAKSPLHLKEKDFEKYKSVDNNFKNINQIEKKDSNGRRNFTVPTELEVMVEFESRNYSSEEAKDFYQYNSANKWSNKSGQPIIWQDHIDSWIKHSFRALSNSDKKSIAEIVSTLLDHLKVNDDVWRHIRPEYADELNLNDWQQFLEQAEKYRLSLLSTSNQKKDGDLLLAYQSGDRQGKLIQQDFAIITKIAKRIAVMDYLKRKLSIEN